MPRRDLDEALSVHAALMQTVVAHPGGRDDAAAMRHVSNLCQAAVDAVNDLDARVIIRGIESLARLLFSADGHVGIQAGPLRGIEALKFQIFNALSNLRGRLQTLQSLPPSKPELPALAPKRNIRVLVVEDNRDSADSLRRLLEICGYTVTVAYSSREGLEAARRAPPDVVLCDIGLPDSDGYALATALRSNPSTSRARLIAVTAYKTEEYRQRSREAGFQLHLVKPVSPTTLLQELDEAPKKNHGEKKSPETHEGLGAADRTQHG
jgi:CheY-like chemotaxis protein